MPLRSLQNLDQEEESDKFQQKLKLKFPGNSNQPICQCSPPSTQSKKSPPSVEAAEVLTCLPLWYHGEDGGYRGRHTEEHAAQPLKTQFLLYHFYFSFEAPNCYSIFDCFLFLASIFITIIENTTMDHVLDQHEQPNHKNSHIFAAIPFYSVEKILKQTSSLEWKRQKSLHISLPGIMGKMEDCKADMQKTMQHNHWRLNCSFSGYLKNEVDLAREELKKKKITKRKKEDKGQKAVETPPVEREEAKLELQLRLSPLLNRCFDSLFPAIRYGPALMSWQKKVYLLGGYHQTGVDGLSMFHRYDEEGRKWVQVHVQGESPKVSPCFHSLQIYKNHMVIVGGVSFEGQKGKRFNTDFLMFNLEKGEWLRGRGGVSLKHHASTLFGSTLMISGGLNDKQKFSQDLYFVSFTGGNLLNPLIFAVKNQADTTQLISHHKMVNTYEVEPVLRSKIKMEGVFSFGGEDQNGFVNNNITFINVMGKAGQNLDIKFKKWEVVTTNEDRPCPRKDHSFSIINKKAIAILAGGINQQGNWLADVWVFDFIRLLWSKVSTEPTIEESIGSLGSHCACTGGTTIFLYNGNVHKKRERAFWSMQTEPTMFKSKKTIFSTKLPSFKSIKSEKQNFSLHRI